MESPSRSVLVIDDDTDLAGLVAALFAEVGVRVTATPDLPTALQVVSETPPDAVVIELMLFGPDGIAVVGEVRRTAGRNLPVVMTNGWADEQLAEQARAAGVDDFLVHPVAEELVDAVLRVTSVRVR
jgi:CheY-like chemotaxis protein